MSHLLPTHQNTSVWTQQCCGPAGQWDRCWTQCSIMVPSTQTSASSYSISTSSVNQAARAHVVCVDSSAALSPLKHTVTNHSYPPPPPLQWGSSDANTAASLHSLIHKDGSSSCFESKPRIQTEMNEFKCETWPWLNYYYHIIIIDWDCSL